MASPSPHRRLPVGAEPLDGGGVHFRVWAPERRVAVELLEHPTVVDVDRFGDLPTRASVVLEREAEGYHSGVVADAAAGMLYRLRLDEERACADPASRHQPFGPHGPSRVVDPRRFRWTDEVWCGVARDDPGGPVIYELHVGTFTTEGTWRAAAGRLPWLRDLGVTVVQVMPVGDFPGRFGWGYDGVFLFAPYHGYGDPESMRAFVDAAHAEGLGVILDVVYNHVGPDGECLRSFSPYYYSGRRSTDWGVAFNFDGPESGPVRALFLANVRHWIEEYHLDGFRFDATQDIHDYGPDHILAALAREARAAAGGRRVLLLAENEPQNALLVTPSTEGGYGLDVIGNEDFHHAVVVALTGRRAGYYGNHRGTPQELLSALRHGFLYQGQWYAWQNQRRGTPSLRLPHRALAHFLENHDQVANRPGSVRLHAIASPGSWRALVAVQLLAPQTPFLFQGQEFAASAPFCYFADHRPEIAAAVRRGRSSFLRQFPDLATPEAQAALPDPGDPDTFRRSKLDWRECETHAGAVALHRDLIRLRLDDPVFSGRARATIDGAVLDTAAFLLRWLVEEEADGTDRLLLVNYGSDLELDPAPEPLLAPPTGRAWSLLWSSEHPRYGGAGTPPVDEKAWHLPGRATLALAATEVRGRGARRPRPAPLGDDGTQERTGDRERH